MTNPDNDLPIHRRNLRWPSHDYTSHGAYFVTIVTLDRVTLLGSIDGDSMVPSAAGDAVTACWNDLPSRFPTIELDAFVVMPNHVHCLLWLRSDGDNPAAPTLGDVIGAFKSLSAGAVNQALARSGSLWQRNYFERVIRNGRELKDVRQYILDNPTKWAIDRENPERA